MALSQKLPHMTELVKVYQVWYSSVFVTETWPSLGNVSYVVQ